MLETWAVVLGSGERSGVLKRSVSAPLIANQCSLPQSSNLLQEALARAATVALPSHICTVLESDHRKVGTSAVTGLDGSNVFIQPLDRGTAFGILLALCAMETRNPAATLVFLPADHSFREEVTVTRILRATANLADADNESTYLIGTEADRPDSELGYILPAEKVVDKPALVTGFKDKPSFEHAQELIALGALWSLSILVGSVAALLHLFQEAHIDLVDGMREALKRKAAGHRDAVDTFYGKVGPMDFAADVLEINAGRLKVMRVAPCGWIDFSSPRHGEAAIRSIPIRRLRTTPPHPLR